MSFVTSSHFTLYWTVTPEERQDLASVRRADYAASNQLQRVKPGDVLWIVNVYLNRLWLLGRLQVETVVSDTAIAQELVDTGREWIEADWYAIANRRQIEPLREVNISAIAGQLRFQSKVDRLQIVGGKIDAKQLTSLRELTPVSAKLLEDAWYDEAYVPQSVDDFLELTEDDQAYAEGKLIVRTVKQRQRNRRLVTDAKSQFKAEYGHLFCEACGFDFTEVYGIEYIEAHHTQAVASLNEDHESTLDDLAMLCANCHRIIHSHTPPLSIEEVKQLIHSRRGKNS